MKVLADGWYANELGLQTLEDEPLPSWLAKRLGSPLARGIALWWRSRGYDRLALIGSGNLLYTVILLERLWPRRRRYLVLLQFIPVSEQAWSALGRGSKLKNQLRRWFERFVLAPVLRSSLARAHALSSWEPRRNAELFGVDPVRFVFLPWPLSFDGDELPAYSSRGRRVLASGRSLCDWPTVFAAAEDQAWDLEIVCTKDDLPKVNRLNTVAAAQVRHDIPLQEHRDLVGEVAVYLLALEEAEVSSGQIRVMDAVRGGTPLAAARVKGLADYVHDGETALQFPPGDTLAARQAVNRLLSDRELSERLRRTAFERARARTREQYMASIRSLILE